MIRPLHRGGISAADVQKRQKSKSQKWLTMALQKEKRMKILSSLLKGVFLSLFGEHRQAVEFTLVPTC